MHTPQYISYVASACIVGVLIIFLHGNPELHEALISDETRPWVIFVQVYGVLYAILFGFLLIEALNKFNTLSQLLDDELNQLQDIRDAMILFDNKQKIEKNVLERLRGYAESVIRNEWGKMERIASSNSDTSQPLYRLIEAVHDLKVTNPTDSVALTLVTEKVFSVSTLRTKRINLSNRVLPPRLLLLIQLMSFAMIISIVVIGVRELWEHLFMVVILTVSIHLLYSVMRDLDSPFKGVWNLSKVDFEKFVKSLDT